MFEELLGRQFHPLPVGARNDLQRADRVASQREKVVVHTHPFDLQHGLPDGGEDFLGPVARRNIGWQRRGSLLSGIRQRGPVQLAVRSQGNGVETDEVLRHHVVRQAKRKPGPNAGRIQRRGSGQIGHELLRAVAGLADHRNGIGHPRLSSQLRLDVAQFDAKPAQLDLMIDTSQKFNRAVGSPFRPVARTVHPGSRHAAEGIGNETLRRRLWSAEIPTRDLLPADVEFSRQTERDRLSIAVEHMRLVEGEWATDRHVALGLALRCFNQMGQHADRRFGRAVVIDDRAAGHEPADLLHEVTAQGLATEDEATGWQHPFWLRRMEESPEVARDDLQDLDLPPMHGSGHRVGVEAVLRRKQMQGTPRTERTEQGRVAEIGGHRRDRSHARTGGHRVELQDRADIGRHLPMFHGHSLGTTGGAGGIDHIGKIRR